MYRTPPNRKISDLTFFVTASLRDRQLLFADDAAAKIVLDSLQFFRAHGEIELYGYVIMPDHVHFVVRPVSPLTLPNMMRRFKTYTAHTIGAGAIWEDGYHSEVLTHAGIVKQKLNYIHENPVRQKLATKAENFRWSSAGAYTRGEPFELLDYVFGPPTLEAGRARQ